MKKTYKKATFICLDYDDMMKVFEEKYSQKYQLIGYRLTRISGISQRATLMMYPKKEEIQNGKGNK